MKKVKAIATNNAEELAAALRLSAQDLAEMQVRRQLNNKIVAAVKAAGLTHEAVARRARTSRTRLTAILNRNTARVSTDLMLRILAALGYRARVSFSRIRKAA